MTLRAEINKELRHLLATDERVILLGQSIRDSYGGACKVTRGLSTKYPDRVLDLPISEAASIGMAVGLAIEGKIPIVEIMFANFLTLCVDQIERALELAYYLNIPFKIIIRAMYNEDEMYGPSHTGYPELLLDMWVNPVYDWTVVRSADQIYKRAIICEANVVVLLERKQSY